AGRSRKARARDRRLPANLHARRPYVGLRAIRPEPGQCASERVRSWLKLAAGRGARGGRPIRARHGQTCVFWRPVRVKIMKTIRISNGEGFWGAWLDAPIQLVERGPIDYLTLDYLAEITMSIMQKQKSRDPNAGYARDFLYVVGRTLPKCLDENIK